MTNISLPETSVFIDGDWLHYTVRRLGKEVDYARLWEVLQEHFGGDTPVYFFGSFDPQRQEQTDFFQLLNQLGYVVHVSPLKRKKDRVTIKGIDVALAVHAALLPVDVKTIVLISGDGDFIPLVEQLRKHGKKVIIVAIPAASRNLVKAADSSFINLERLIRNLDSGKGIPSYKGARKKVLPPESMYIEKGEFFTPYLVIRKIFTSAKDKIILIDPYVNAQILQMVQLISCSVSICILTNRVSPSDFCVQVQKLRSEGYNISVRKTDFFHDRFLCVDGNWWHSGHSFKDLGGKDSLINKIEDSSSLEKLQKRVEQVLSSSVEYCE